MLTKISKDFFWAGKLIFTNDDNERMMQWQTNVTLIVNNLTPTKLFIFWQASEIIFI